MTRERVEELVALKEIAETLNVTNDMHHMLNAVLKKLLEVTGLKTGWIFLMDEQEREYTCVVDANLPPALSWGNKTPMCQDSCWCVDKFWSRRLQNAVNIINCKRIEDATELKWGDTEGIYHHATVPLKAGGEWFGLLNVAAPGKTNFTQEELALLESVGYQIGTAIKRTRLYHAEQKRAENYLKLGEISKELGIVTELHKIPGETVQAIGSRFDWASASFFIPEGSHLSLRSLFTEGKVMSEWKSIPVEEAGPVGIALRSGKPEKAVAVDCPGLKALGFPAFRASVAVPIHLRGQVTGLLFFTSPKASDFDEDDLELLQSLADHISIIMENARLYQQRRELTKLEERNRLARDLHDSVCQNLFSLTLMARGMESVLADNSPLAVQSLREMQKLTEESLKEMRSLIWQLRPAGLEQGLLTALEQYGTKLGLTVHVQLEGICNLPRTVEETLLRIGQEALNNVRKHAGVDEVSLRLKVTEWQVRMEIRDDGCGFQLENHVEPQSLGMLSMRERAEMLGGLFSVESRPGKGTRLTVSFPL
ncbi:GAF domain-containing sensor histidine kinase [Brevibacillus sp. H7]|uniref:GAF domain-containing sensor histidine kinase n=1 Tax=Brevibacillus sp. H7 TaxID=3349138 RepID=UPI0037F71F8F